MDPNLALTPGMLLDIADALRMALSGTDMQGQRESMEPLLETLVALREGMLDTAARTTKKAYDLEFLISCLLTSGYLKAASKLKENLRHGLRAAVQDVSARHFYEDLLNESHNVPETSTIIAHRLTLVLAWCRQQAARFQPGRCLPRLPPEVVLRYF